MEDLGFELLASSLRADMGDLKAFVEALASKLEGALPDQTHVRRKGGGFFSKAVRVEEIVVDMGEERFQLRADGGRVEPTRCKVVRGIVLKSESVPLDEWIDQLSLRLTEQAQRSEQARMALQRLLGA